MANVRRAFNVLFGQQKSHKRKLSSFTMIKPWLIFVRVVMSTCFEDIEAVAFLLQKGGQKLKIK